MLALVIYLGLPLFGFEGHKIYPEAYTLRSWRSLRSIISPAIGPARCEPAPPLDVGGVYEIDINHPSAVTGIDRHLASA